MRITRNMVNMILNDPYMEINMIYRHFNGNVPMVMIEPNRKMTRKKNCNKSHKITLKYNTILTGYILLVI